MSLKNSIKKVLKESMKDELIKLINDYGFDAASRYVGGFDSVKDILGKEFMDKVKSIFNRVIDERFKGMEFKKDDNGIAGHLPRQDFEHLVPLYCEKNSILIINKKVLWMCTQDYDYFLSVTKLPEKEIREAVIDWFAMKTKLIPDMVLIQDCW